MPPTPRHWTSLDETEPDATTAPIGPDSGEPAPGVPIKPATEVSRRDFFRLMGLSASAAALACKRAPVQQVLPFTVAPDGPVPGVANWYATACRACDAGCGLLVKVRDGRPIKIEGNPLHPESGGGVCATGQASVLGVYDDGRLRSPARRGQPLSWSRLDDHVNASLERIGHAGGAIRLVVPAAPGPSAEAALRCFTDRHPTARVVRHEPMGERRAIAEGLGRLTGHPAIPRLRLDRARVVASFGADFLGTWLSPVVFTRQYTIARRSGLRHWQIEPTLSLTGSNADRRIPLSPSRILPSLNALLGAISRAQRGEQPGEADEPWIGELAAELLGASGGALVVCGSDQILSQQLTHAINARLGAVGRTIELRVPATAKRARSADPRPAPSRDHGQTPAPDGARRTPAARSPASDASPIAAAEISFEQFVAELCSDRLAAVILIDANPVHCDPRGPRIAAALGRLELGVALADRLDETAASVELQAPVTHFLESWGDTEDPGGVIGLQQPTLRPLWDAREAWQSVLRWSGVDTGWYDFLKTRWKRKVLEGSAEEAFDGALRRGFAVPPAPAGTEGGDTSALAAPAVEPALPAPPPEPAGDATPLELCLYQTVALRQGDHANNAWLQGLPDPITKASWSNYLCIEPALATRLGLETGRVVRITTAEARVEVPVLVQPGTAPNVVALAVGYGRSRAGAIGNGVGVNAFPLARVTDDGVTASRTDFELQRLDELRAIPLAQAHSTFAGLPRPDRPRPETTAATPPSRRRERRWGMLIDLAACTGCSACVVSCQAENNIPSAGPGEALRRRDLHWLRIDRYFEGPADNPKVVHQPVMCQHCGNAPCERMCPVLATVTSSEGLNQQVYARCIGSRACATTCPVGARRFNWFEQPRGEIERMVLNPDVVVRGRGVMEKCSMCAQRIEEEKARARLEGRPLRDEDLQTACQQSCPAQAILFGDLGDPSSAVARRAAAGDSFALLPHLKLDAAVRYLPSSARRGGR